MAKKTTAEIRGVDVSDLISPEQLETDRPVIEQLLKEYDDPASRKFGQPDSVKVKLAILYARTDVHETQDHLKKKFGAGEAGKKKFLEWLKEHPTEIQLCLHLPCSLDEARALLRRTCNSFPEMNEVLRPKSSVPGKMSRRFKWGSEHLGWVKKKGTATADMLSDFN